MIMTNDFPIMLHKYLTNFLPNERGYSENTIKTYSGHRNLQYQNDKSYTYAHFN